MASTGGQNLQREGNWIRGENKVVLCWWWLNTSSRSRKVHEGRRPVCVLFSNQMKIQHISIFSRRYPPLVYGWAILTLLFVVPTTINSIIYWREYELQPSYVCFNQVKIIYIDWIHIICYELFYSCLKLLGFLWLSKFFLLVQITPLFLWKIAFDAHEVIVKSQYGQK